MNKKRKIHNWVIGILLGAIAAISLFPFYWNLVSAFKPVSEIFTYPPSLIPNLFTCLLYTSPSPRDCS